MSKRLMHYLGACECPECHVALKMVQRELIELNLTKAGEPIQNNTTDYEDTLFCPQCKTQYDYIKKGMNFEIYTYEQAKMDAYRMYKIELNDNPFAKEV